MHGFLSSELRREASHFRLWRHGPLLALELFGPVDDEGSERWRREVLEECERHGWPRFVAVDLRRLDPQNTMLGRFRTASTGRVFLSRVEWLYALTGASPGPLIVVRTVLRVIGATNVSFLSAEEDFRKVLAETREGRRAFV